MNCGSVSTGTGGNAAPWQAPIAVIDDVSIAVIASVSEATQGAGLIYAQGLPKPLGCFVAALLAMTGVVASSLRSSQ